MSLKRSVIFISICAILFGTQCFAQSYRMAPIAVKRSTFVQQVKSLRSGKPTLSSVDLATAANNFLNANGINFAIAFDGPTCERFKNAKAQQKDPSAPLLVGAAFKSVEADVASLALPEPQFPTSGCACYIEVPVLQMTDAEFIAVISGRNIRFHLPSNLHTFAAVLVDHADRTKVKGRWRIPFRGNPIGVSHDENVLYLAFPEPELADLSMAIFKEGVFEVTTRSEAEDGGKGKTIKSARPGVGTVQFDRWGKSLVVEYLPPCS